MPPHSKEDAGVRGHMKILYILIILFLLVTAGCSKQLEQTETNAVPQSESSPAMQDTKIVYEAALQGDIKTVQNYLKNGFDVNRSNQDQQSLLMLAGFNGHTKLCRLLLEKGAEVDARDINGRTALMFASTGPFAETVRLLLKSGADPKAVDSGERFTALMHAAAEGQLEVVKVLLENGADKSVKDVDGDTAEMFARQNGHLSVADYLRDYE